MNKLSNEQMNDPIRISIHVHVLNTQTVVGDIFPVFQDVSFRNNGAAVVAADVSGSD